MLEKQPQKLPEHTSEHVKPQNFGGHAPPTPPHLWAPHLYLPRAPTILSAVLYTTEQQRNSAAYSGKVKALG